MKLIAPLFKYKTNQVSSIANINSAYLYLNQKGIIKYVSTDFYKLIGQNRKQIKGKVITDLIALKRPLEVQKQIGKLTPESPFSQISLHFIREDRSTIKGELFLTLTSLRGNKRIFAIFRKSSFHQERYDHLFEKKEKLRILAENTTHVQILLDKDFKCLYLSPSCYSLCGYHYHEVIDKNLYNYIHPEDFDLVWETLNIPNSSKQITIHFRIKHKQNKYLTVEGRIVKIADDFNIPLYYALYLNDASRQKRYEQELIKAKTEADIANELKTNFLTSISHELRTPLNAIIGYSSILDRKCEHPDLINYSKSIKNSGYQLLNMVENLLSYSQIEKKEYNIKYVDVNINSFFKKLIPNAKNDAILEEKQDLEIICEWETLDGMPLIYTDEDVLLKIFRNLLNNAIKFTSNGFVRYGCKPYGIKSYMFFVEDSGIGISSDDYHKIFEKFTQKDGSLTKEYGGTGIGLSVTKKMIELLNGEIWVLSEVGKGSAFYFTLPHHHHSK